MDNFDGEYVEIVESRAKPTYDHQKRPEMYNRTANYMKGLRKPVSHNKIQAFSNTSSLGDHTKTEKPVFIPSDDYPEDVKTKEKSGPTIFLPGNI